MWDADAYQLALREASLPRAPPAVIRPRYAARPALARVSVKEVRSKGFIM